MPTPFGSGSSETFSEEYWQHETAIALETFKHPIFLLVERYSQWGMFLKALLLYFEAQKQTADALTDNFQDAAKALMETSVLPSIIDQMTRPDDADESVLKRAKAKLDNLKEKLVFLGQAFKFDYAADGGVMRNLERLKYHAERMADLEKQRQESLIGNAIDVIKYLQTSVVEVRQNALNEWVNGFYEARCLHGNTTEAWRRLNVAIQSPQMDRSSTPLPENDPLLCWLHFRSLSDSYVTKVNALQIAAVIHQEECKRCENTLVDSMKNGIHEYIRKARSHNSQVKALFSNDKIPIDGNSERQLLV